MIPCITHIFVHNYIKQFLKNILEMQDLTDIILCVILMHMINKTHNMFMTVAAVAVHK